MLLMVFGSAAHGQKQPERVLFRVGEHPVFASEFEYVYLKNHRTKPEAFTTQAIQEYLDLYIHFKLKVAEAYSRKIDTTRAFITEYSGYKNEVFKSYQTRRDDLEYLVTEAYERMKEEVRASHLLLMVDPEASPADTVKVWEQITSIRNRILSGESFPELARAYSADPGAAQNGGDLGYFTALEMVYPFENAAYLTPVGGISMPIRTRFGYHLINVTDRRPATKPQELASNVNELRKRVEQDERTYLSALRQLEFQKKAFGFTENRPVVEQVLSLADSSLLRGRWEFYGSPDLRTQTLFTLAGEPIKVWSFVEFIGREQQPIPMAAMNGLQPRILMQQMLDGFVSMRATLAEEKRLLKENESYRMLLKEYQEGILLFTVMEQEVWKKAAADTEGQRKYYDRHAMKYQAGERVRARLLGLNDPAIAEAVMEKYRSADSISRADLRKFRSVTSFRNYEKGESRIVDMVPWKSGLHKAEYDKMIWLVEVKELLGPGIRSLEESRTSVMSDYQVELESEWLKALREKFPVKVDESLKKKTFKALIRDGQSGSKTEKSS